MAEEGGFLQVMQDAIGACYEGAMERVATQGAAELASALFGGSNAYVAYGDGQKSIEVEAPQIDMGSQAIEAPVQDVQAVAPPAQEYGGMEM